jgi:hypothetical protein
MPSIPAQVLFVLSVEILLVHCKLQYGENAVSLTDLNSMCNVKHLIMFPWQTGAILTERSAGCWEEKPPARCCGSAAPVGWRRLHLATWWSSSPNRPGYSAKHASSKWNPGGRWLLLADSIQTMWWLPGSRWSHGAAAGQLHRTAREDGKPEPEASWSQGCSAFEDTSCPEAHPDVDAMSCSLFSAAFLAASPNHRLRISLPWCSVFALGFGSCVHGSLLEDPGVWGFMVLCLRTWDYWEDTGSLLEGICRISCWLRFVIQLNLYWAHEPL